MSQVAAFARVLRALADEPVDSPVMNKAVRASVATLNAGVTQQTSMCDNPELMRKHHARLSAALKELAAELEARGHV